MSLDPRPAVIERRFAEVGRLIGVSGGKGGIGKTCTAALTALALARQGAAVGLLDLDFTGPCAHMVLGVEARIPREDFGVLPLEVGGLHGRDAAVGGLYGAQGFRETTHSKFTGIISDIPRYAENTINTGNVDDACIRAFFE